MIVETTVLYHLPSVLVGVGNMVGLGWGEAPKQRKLTLASMALTQVSQSE